MIGNEAAQLRDRFVGAWPMGVKGTVWFDVLVPLDFEEAKAAYKKLRDTRTWPPAVADFQAVLAAQRRAAAAEKRAKTPPCSRCNDTGWVDIPDRDAIAPCPECRTGEYGNTLIGTINGERALQDLLAAKVPGIPPHAAAYILADAIEQGRQQLQAIQERQRAYGHAVPEPQPGDPWYRSGRRLVRDAFGVELPHTNGDHR